MSKAGRRSRLLSADEHALWGHVTKSVSPLKRRKIAAEAPQNEVPSLADKPKHKVPAMVAPVSTRAPKAAPPLAPLDRRMKQKVARGKEPIDTRIDLHGMTQSEAHHALARFLRATQRDGARVALVITGKGARPGADPFGERGVLRRQVPLWLESAELRPFVIGFESASQGHGGQGALYVRVRRARD